MSERLVEWLEADLVPCTAEEQSARLVEAIRKFSHLLPPLDECTCECGICQHGKRWREAAGA